VLEVLQCGYRKVEYLDVESPLVEFVPPMKHVSDDDFSAVEELALAAGNVKVHARYSPEDLQKLSSDDDYDKVDLMLRPNPPMDKVSDNYHQLAILVSATGGALLYYHPVNQFSYKLIAARYKSVLTCRCSLYIALSKCPWSYVLCPGSIRHT
jgi:hypothetical protein